MKIHGTIETNPDPLPERTTLRVEARNGRYFTIDVLGCDNPDCGALHLSCFEIEAPGGQRPGGLNFLISLNSETWSEMSSPPRSAEAAELVNEFITDLPEATRNQLREFSRNLQTLFQRRADFRLDPDEVAQGLVIPYSDYEMAEHSHVTRTLCMSFPVVSGGKKYQISDLYCPNPDCDCRNVMLDFYRIDSKPEGGEFPTKMFTGSTSLSGKTQIDKLIACDHETARELLLRWGESYPERLKTMRKRYGEIKELGRRSLAAAPAAISATADPQEPQTMPVPINHKTGRNDPCPCGSGRKYKRCCGAP